MSITTIMKAHMDNLKHKNKEKKKNKKLSIAKKAE
jgi:hypothetical protein